MATRTSVKMGLSGPFFTKNVQATMQDNIRLMMQAMEEEGARYAIEELRAGESGRAPIAAFDSTRRHRTAGRLATVTSGGDRSASHIKGRVASVSGKRWTYHATISINNIGFSRAQGISLMAAAAQAERETQAFKRTAARLRASRAVNAAELTRGLE